MEFRKIKIVSFFKKEKENKEEDHSVLRKKFFSIFTQRKNYLWCQHSCGFLGGFSSGTIKFWPKWFRKLKNYESFFKSVIIRVCRHRIFSTLITWLFCIILEKEIARKTLKLLISMLKILANNCYKIFYNIMYNILLLHFLHFFTFLAVKA